MPPPLTDEASVAGGRGGTGGAPRRRRQQFLAKGSRAAPRHLPRITPGAAAQACMAHTRECTGVAPSAGARAAGCDVAGVAGGVGVVGGEGCVGGMGGGGRSGAGIPEVGSHRTAGAKSRRVAAPATSAASAALATGADARALCGAPQLRDTLAGASARARAGTARGGGPRSACLGRRACREAPRMPSHGLLAMLLRGSASAIGARIGSTRAVEGRPGGNANGPRSRLPRCCKAAGRRCHRGPRPGRGARGLRRARMPGPTDADAVHGVGRARLAPRSGGARSRGGPYGSSIGGVSAPPAATAGLGLLGSVV